jgi:hypothetical protein
MMIVSNLHRGAWDAEVDADNDMMRWKRYKTNIMNEINTE